MMTTATATYVIDVTDQTFAAEVLERSKTVPVVVDFWAAWCGPCRTLGPVLERLAAEFAGGIILAKLDVDQNPAAARQFQVQGIPAVKAFRGGKLVNEFTGELPEPQVRKFIEGLAPSEADLLAQQGFQWETGDQPAMAEANYRAALEKKADHYPAMVGLGRVLLNQGQIDAGKKVLENVPPGAPERAMAEAIIATAQFNSAAAGHTEAELRAAIEANPADVESRYALASLLASRHQFASALPEFLEVVRRDRRYNDDGARKSMLAIFTILGDNRPIVAEYRRKLANALF
jgi:putative thioredoxin